MLKLMWEQFEQVILQFEAFAVQIKYCGEDEPSALHIQIPFMVHSNHPEEFVISFILSLVIIYFILLHDHINK